MTSQKINTSLVLIIFFAVHQYTASTQNNTNIHFVIEETSFDRLCQSKKILTINGRFPGPTIYARAGETLALDVENRGKDNVTMFCCRGVGRHVESDQVEWLVHAGSTVRKNITISDDEEGTLWWHAMNIWQRATVHGAFIVHPKPGKIVNAAIRKKLYFGIASHNLTVIAMDGSPLTKPFTTDYVELSVEHSIDCIFEANQHPDYYYMVAVTNISKTYDTNKITTAIIEYQGNYIPSSPPLLPNFSLNYDKSSSRDYLYVIMTFCNFGFIFLYDIRCLV
ncbi:hypothetical protein R3W88_012259 [Solanum pinnatisectum]|uniref:Uncharacterized protein n=1 Tax=Solanum pinnatisectum TaxID=50273 RepID=A0AAV9L8V2_9SOLN|nr:hypothetical protein R3W88_012259 [Solanum pinnatisectum]